MSYQGFAGEGLIHRICERELDGVLVLFGGTIPKDDIRALKAMGIHGIFPFRSKLEEISAFIKQNVREASMTTFRLTPGAGCV